VNSDFLRKLFGLPLPGCLFAASLKIQVNEQSSFRSRRKMLSLKIVSDDVPRPQLKRHFGILSRPAQFGFGGV